MTTRPLAIIDVEIHFTRLAIKACDDIPQTVLAKRRELLSDGWPVGHAMCEGLDETAAQWAAQANFYRRELGKLMTERDGEDPS